MNDLEYRRKQLERLQDEVIDIEDLGNGISITDLTLNDFRMDLSDYLKEHESELVNMPVGTFAVTKGDDLYDEVIKPGVLFCLRSNKDHFKKDTTYALAPHYLVYVGNDGEVELQFSQTKKILDLFKKTSLGKKEPDNEAIMKFEEDTKRGRNMKHYQYLLSKAVQAVTGKAEEQGVQSLFQRGGTTISKDSFRGIDDFEVVSYLIVQN